MTYTGSLISADTIRTLGWTLASFLWQGAALAAILWVLLGFVRSASVRYRTAVLVLLLMAVAPIGTFLWLDDQVVPAVSAPPANALVPAMVQAILTPEHQATETAVYSLRSIDWPSCLVWAWLTGVAGFGIRAAGGWLFVQRLYREKRRVLPHVVTQRCTKLQRALGVSRAVSYFESALVDAPAVIGWFRPVVLIPASALTGLSPDQLDAIITHEMAHIKRLDCFVNLFQIAAETLLFYQPAVWWVSKIIRAERENCCDDVAVAVCGDAGAYARALTKLEMWRSAPVAVLAANSGSLKSRISRLLGADTIVRSAAPGGVAVLALVCAAGVVAASTSFHYERSVSWSDNEPALRSAGDSMTADLRPPMPAPPAAPRSNDFAVCPREAAADSLIVAAAGFKRVSAVAPAIETDESGAQDASQASPQSASGVQSSYIEGLQAAGLKNVTVEELIALKVQGVTPDYVRQVHQTWPEASVHDLIRMKVQGITPDYVQQVRRVWPNADLHDIISMKVQGVTPEYVRQVRQTWPDASVHDIIGMKVQGITPEYVREVRQTWPNASLHEIIAMKVQGVNPADKTEFERLGLGGLTVHEVIAFRVQNITPDYVRELQSAGLRNLTPRDVIEAKVQDVSPEFIRQVQAHGFKNLTIRQLLGLKMANVF